MPAARGSRNPHREGNERYDRQCSAKAGDRRYEGSFVHFACAAEARPEYLERRIAHLDVNAPVPGPLRLLVSVRMGITPSMTAQAGATPTKWDTVDVDYGE